MGFKYALVMEMHLKYEGKDANENNVIDLVETSKLLSNLKVSLPRGFEVVQIESIRTEPIIPKE